MLVIVESPYAGDVTRNLRYLRAALKDCLDRGESPYASHGLYTQEGVLDDRDPTQRRKGIEAGFRWWDAAAVVVFYTDLGWSPGMLAAKERAKVMGKTWTERTIPGWCRCAPPPRITVGMLHLCCVTCGGRV